MDSSSSFRVFRSTDGSKSVILHLGYKKFELAGYSWVAPAFDIFSEGDEPDSFLNEDEAMTEIERRLAVHGGVQ